MSEQVDAGVVEDTDRRRWYQVPDVRGDRPRIVNAVSRAQAYAHVHKPAVAQVRPLKLKEFAALMKRWPGIKIEEAGEAGKEES